MKITTIIVAVLGLSFSSYTQTETSSANEIEISNAELFKAVKPENARPAVFASQEELEFKVSDKIKKTKQKLIDNRNNPELVLRYQEQLWRFENAIVAETLKN